MYGRTAVSSSVQLQYRRSNPPNSLLKSPFGPSIPRFFDSGAKYSKKLVVAHFGVLIHSQPGSSVGAALHDASIRPIPDRSRGRRGGGGGGGSGRRGGGGCPSTIRNIELVALSRRCSETSQFKVGVTHPPAKKIDFQNYDTHRVEETTCTRQTCKTTITSCPAVAKQ